LKTRRSYWILKASWTWRVSSQTHRWRKCETVLCNQHVIFAHLGPFVALHHEKISRWLTDRDLHRAYDLCFTSPAWLSGSRWSIFSFISSHL